MNAGCVGMRGALGTPPWAVFPTEPAVRFEFPDRDTLDRELLIPLKVVGKHTFDAG